MIDPRLNTASIKAKNSLDANLDEVLPLIGGNSRRNRKCKALDDNCRRKGEAAVCIGWSRIRDSFASLNRDQGMN